MLVLRWVDLFIQQLSPAMESVSSPVLKSHITLAVIACSKASKFVSFLWLVENSLLEMCLRVWRNNSGQHTHIFSLHFLIGVQKGGFTFLSIRAAGVRLETAGIHTSLPEREQNPSFMRIHASQMLFWPGLWRKFCGKIKCQRNNSPSCK